jgi:hypothetical protein
MFRKPNPFRSGDGGDRMRWEADAGVQRPRGAEGQRPWRESKIRIGVGAGVRPGAYGCGPFAGPGDGASGNKHLHRMETRGPSSAPSAFWWPFRAGFA